MAESPPQPANLFVFETAPASSREFDISDPELVRMLEQSQQTHFWFHARNRQILDFLRRDGLPPPAEILEVGCGTGTVLSALARAGYAMSGVEMHVQLARRAASQSPRSPIYSLNVLEPPARWNEERFDAVALFDVLEHVSEPEAFLRACAALLRPGGMLVGTLPALQMLWSDYDAFAGHRLRYDRRSLRDLFARAGLPVPRASYFFQALLPVMLGRRVLVGQGRAQGDADRRALQHLALDAPGRLANKTLAGACTVERWVRRLVTLDGLPGPSLWFSARIPDPAGIKTQTPPRGDAGTP